jgi:hypothetical protein
MEQYINIFYTLSVVLATWNTLTFVFKSTSSGQRKAVTLAWGLILGAVWFLWLKSEMETVIVGFFAALGFYEVIAKWFNSKIDDSYNNGKGVL